MNAKFLLGLFFAIAFLVSCGEEETRTSKIKESGYKESPSKQVESKSSSLAYNAATDLYVHYVKEPLKEPALDASFWQNKAIRSIALTAQPFVAPRPTRTTTESLEVVAVHNNEWIAFRFKWKDKELSEASKLGEFSDALAIMFPVHQKEVPPVITMGSRSDPVHIFHWRAQYQKDKEKGLQSMKDMYPNMTTDMYPLEFDNMEHANDKALLSITQHQREVFSPGKVAGNPQSFQKVRGIDEMLAEGFGSSAVIENALSYAQGHWENGEWTLVLSRPLFYDGGSTLNATTKGFMAFAVWQGGEKEVGSRKCVTIKWVPVFLEIKK